MSKTLPSANAPKSVRGNSSPRDVKGRKVIVKETETGISGLSTSISTWSDIAFCPDGVLPNAVSVYALEGRSRGIVIEKCAGTLV
jgi:hypothetical protein